MMLDSPLGQLAHGRRLARGDALALRVRSVLGLLADFPRPLPSLSGGQRPAVADHVLPLGTPEIIADNERFLTARHDLDAKSSAGFVGIIAFFVIRLDPLLSPGFRPEVLYVCVSEHLQWASGPAYPHNIRSMIYHGRVRNGNKKSINDLENQGL